MKHEKIDDKARVWMITRGSDGRLHDELDPRFLAALRNADSAEDVAEAVVIAAGELEIAETRAW
jgi:hypothetical protein